MEAMKMAKLLSMLALLFCFVLPCDASTYDYHGKWATTSKRKLDGMQTAEVTYFGNNQWSGRFHGSWRGTKYDYTVSFNGPYNDLRGTAQIDGANYQWTGQISAEKFIIRFTGDRYTGWCDMKRVK
jgi:hypothetical protein